MTTVFAIVMSSAFTFVILTLTTIAQIGNRVVSGMWTAATVALFLTPLISYVFFKLIHQLEKAETEARILAQTDSLTGIMNRRYFTEVASQALRNTESYPISGMIIDINNFKHVNDNFGHLTGDRMLILFCDLVSTVIRETDIFGRLGGDEFALLFPRTDQTEILGVLDRISSQLEFLEIRTDDGKLVDISISIGISSIKDTALIDLENLVRRADLALYEAKQKSRNSTGKLFYNIAGN